MPTLSAARGYSPAAITRRPGRVRKRKYHVSGTRAKATGTRIEREDVIRGNCSTLGERPALPNRVGSRKAVMPPAKMLIAVPATTWSPRRVMHHTAWTVAPAAAAATPIARPSRLLPV